MKNVRDLSGWNQKQHHDCEVGCLDGAATEKLGIHTSSEAIHLAIQVAI